MLKKTALFLICLYAALAGLSAAVFHLPWRIMELFPEPKRDLMISSGVVSASVHPLYREWLLGFVRTPNAPRTPDYIMDTYHAYGEIIHTTVDDVPSDSLGWPNTVKPSEAGVLFVGDSFANGASVGTRQSPPSLYATLTGAAVYNASNGGYGLGQYVRIVDHLTRGLPPGQRFAGKNVVVLVYLGNDLDMDIAVYRTRLKYSGDALGWQLALGPLRAWGKELLESYGTRLAHAAPSGAYYPVPMACPTTGGLPFAWHPAFSGLLNRENFTDQIPMIETLVQELKSLESRGLSIKIVLIPHSMQVVGDDIDWSRVGPGTRLAKDVPGMRAMLEEIRGAGKEILLKAGFEVLDVTDTMKASPQRCMLYQPADTHCTALGYETIAQAIAARWPDLGSKAIN